MSAAEPSAAPAAWSFSPALRLMAGRLVGFAATFFVPIVLVRLFEPEVFGTYKQLFLIYSTLYLLGQMGMAESLFYFLPLEPRRTGRYLVNSMAALAVAGGAAAAALWLAAPWVAGWLNNPALTPYLPLVAVYLWLTLAAAGLEIALLCARRYTAATVSYAASDMLRAALLVLPAVVTGELGWLLAGAVAFATVRGVAMLGVVRRLAGGLPRPDRVLFGRQLAYCLPFQLAVVVEVAQANFHQYAVAHRFDAATFAVYAVGCLQIPLVDLATSSAGNVLMVGMGDSQRDGDGSAARAIWTDTTRKLALLLVPLVTLLLVTARDLIPFLFTDRYRGAVPVFAVWTAAVVLGVVQTDSALRVFAEVRAILWLNLLRLALILALVAWSMKVFGLVGAVGVTVVAAAVAKGLALGRLRHRLGVGWRRVLPWGHLGRVVAACLAAALPAAALASVLERGSAVTLALTSVLFLGLVVPLLAAFGAWRWDELPAPLVRFLRPAGRVPRIEPSETR